MKIRPEGAELFRADRRTRRHDNVISRFCAIFANAPKILPQREKPTLERN